jgi:hypothetical protein
MRQLCEICNTWPVGSIGSTPRDGGFVAATLSDFPGLKTCIAGQKALIKIGLHAVDPL